MSRSACGISGQEPKPPETWPSPGHRHATGGHCRRAGPGAGSALRGATRSAHAASVTLAVARPAVGSGNWATRHESPSPEQRSKSQSLDSSGTLALEGSVRM